MNTLSGVRVIRLVLLVAAIAAGLLFSLGSIGAAGTARAELQATAKPAAAPKYIGAAKCKMCHASKESGDQYGHWTLEKHFKAYERLASAESKQLAKSKGIDDPQKADQCVKCHVTAAAEPDDRLARGFDRHAGVQCESCHGPGEKHMKARMLAGEQAGEPQPLPVGEIIGRPDRATCVTCHNKESPSFKAFCFKKRFAEVAHLDPRKKRAPDYLASVKCDCEKCDCEGCKADQGGQ